jgi:glycerophosphoryl diester phosphodiesterase
MENTLLAFDNARAAGVWGLECDIRWTQDDVPVVCHDPTLERVFGLPLVVTELPFTQLKARAPTVPSLAEVLQRYGGDRHLMLEIKTFSPQRLPQQRRIMQQLLENLHPADDFHVLALDPALFILVEFLPPRCLLPVAETNVARLSRLSLQRGYAGLAGHYLLLGKNIQQRHQQIGQRVGTGFPASRRTLLREINRGVDWVFSDDAVALQAERDALLQRTVPN